MAITRRGTQIFKLAADAKPTATDVQVGTELINTDDRKRWVNSGSDWIAQDLMTFNQFNIIKEGATTYVTDRADRIIQSGTDTSTVVNAALAAMPSGTAYEYVWDATPFTIESPILLPQVSGLGLATKRVNMKGTGYAGFRNVGGGSTALLIGTSFPTNRYIFELNCAVGSDNTGHVEIDGFQAQNANFATINAGFCKLEADRSHGYDDSIVKNCYLNYFWRGIHLIGMIWLGRFENIISHELNASFVGDSVILMEAGGHTVNNATPKENIISGLRVMHTAGVYNEAIRIKSGGYNIFQNCFIDGKKYANAVINLNNTETLTIHNNTFQNITSLDLENPAPDTRVAGIYLAGTMVFDNYFHNIRTQPYPVTVMLQGTGVMRNDIELAGYWGTATSVTDTGTDGTNTIRIKGGAKTTAGDVKLTHTGGVSRVIDNRRGASKKGVAVFNGDGTTVSFAIAHGLFATPFTFQITKRGTAIRDINYTPTIDATNITVTFATAPVTGTGNIVLYWSADVYS